MSLDLLRSTAAAIALIDTTDEERGRILRANRLFADLLASSPDALAGTTICDHIHPEDRLKADDAYRRLMASTESLYEQTGRLISADGETVRVHVLASVITASARQVVLLRALPEPADHADS
jgi:PAS domain S-box-containing protein